MYSQVIDERRGAAVSPETLLIKKILSTPEEIIKTGGFQVSELGVLFRASILSIIAACIVTF